jgi:hypothetical protein
MGDMKNAKKIVGKPDGKRLFGRPAHRCEDDTKIDFETAAWGMLIELIWFVIGLMGGVL